MELITFQTLKAFKELIDQEYLLNNSKYIDLQKYGKIYEWILEKMNDKINVKPQSSSYPLWAWVKYGRRKCPSKHKTLNYFSKDEDILVKITFHKNEDDLLLTNFNRFSFLLNNWYIPTDKKDLEQFKLKLSKNHITNDDLKAFMRPDKFLEHRQDKEYIEIVKEIRTRFDLILNTDDDTVQACFWQLDLKDIIQVEFINKKDCSPRNYKKGKNYIKEYIEQLKP